MDEFDCGRGFDCAGDFKLVAKSRGGDAEGPLQTVFRKVKYLYVAPAVPTIDTVAGASVGMGKIKGGEAATANFMGVSVNEAGTIATISALPAMSNADTSMNATLTLTTTRGTTVSKGGLTIVA